MPEIKHNFTGGKMNKDLDERLVPNGEYRHAENIEVSTSEGSNVGTVQNILGNKRVENLVGVNFNCVGSIADEKTNKLYWFISSYEKDVILEYDIANDIASPVLVDLKAGTQKAVLKFFGNIITGINIIDNLLFWTDDKGEPKKINIDVCKAGTPNVNTHTQLSFNHNSFHGIAADYLVSSTAPDGSFGFNSENHPPQLPFEDMPKIGKYICFSRRRFVAMLGYEWGELVDDYGQIMDANNYAIDVTTSHGAPGNIRSNGTIAPFGEGYHFRARHYRNGEFLRVVWMKAFDNIHGTHLRYNETINGYTTTDYDFQIGDVVFAIDVKKDIEEKHITVIKPKPLQAPKVRINYKEVSEGTTKKPNLFEEKFPRFSYRYKYRDGEYSTMAPFTDPVFNPQYTKDTTKSKDASILYNQDSIYTEKEPHNKAMINSIHSVELMDFINIDTPEDVVEVEILYKQEDTPVVYSIGTVKHTDYEWHSNVLNYENRNLHINGAGRYYENVGTTNITGGSTTYKPWMPASDGGYNSGRYTVSTENIYGALPANQLLRPWDNVPRKALSQEISGNRIIYGNYLQNYTLPTNPKVSLSYGNRKQNLDSFDTKGLKSIKSQRNYQMGVVYCDQFGRETPVFTSSEGALNIPWADSNGNKNASKSTYLTTSIDTNFPDWVKGVKFFIKENSGEYYNLVMQRAWTGQSTYELDNGEGHLWISFPSSDRNKVSEDDYLILKKKVGVGESQISFENKYKIIDISNETPEAIKYELVPQGSADNQNDTFTQAVGNYDKLFTNSLHRPDRLTSTIMIHKNRWHSNSSQYDNVRSKLNNAEPTLANGREELYISWFRYGTDNASSSKYKVAGGWEGSNAYVVKLEREISERDADIAHKHGRAVDHTTSADMHKDLIFQIERKVEKESGNFAGQFFVKISKNQISSIIETGNEVSNLEKYQVASAQGVWYWRDDTANGTQTHSNHGHIWDVQGASGSYHYGNTNYFGDTTHHDSANNIQNTGGGNNNTTGVSGGSGVARMTDWHLMWENILGELTGKPRWFVDSVHMSSGQSDQSNYAKYNCVTWSGLISEESALEDGALNGSAWSYPPIKKWWTEVKNEDSKANYGGADNEFIWYEDQDEIVTTSHLFDKNKHWTTVNGGGKDGLRVDGWVGPLQTVKRYDPWTSETERAKNHINGLEGMVTTNEYHTNGPRRWFSGMDGEEFGVGTDTKTYSIVKDDTGKHFMHLSFFAPGQDLHDNTWHLSDKMLYGKDSMMDNLQGIWGGGVFTTESATNKIGDDSDNDKKYYHWPMEGNYTAGDDEEYAVRETPPGPGVGFGYDLNYRELHERQWDPTFNSEGDPDNKIRDFIRNLFPGSTFRFHHKQPGAAGTTVELDDAVFTIKKVQVKKLYNHTNWRNAFNMYNHSGGGYFPNLFGTNLPASQYKSVEQCAMQMLEKIDADGENIGTTTSTSASAYGNTVLENLKKKIVDFGSAHNRRLCFIIELDKNPTDGHGSMGNPLNSNTNGANNMCGDLIYDNYTHVEFLDPIVDRVLSDLNKYPAIWELSPKKKDVDLDIYYEASNEIPVRIDRHTNELFAPKGCKVEMINPNNFNQIASEVYLTEWDNNVAVLSPGFNRGTSTGEEIDYSDIKFKFIREDGSYTIAETGLQQLIGDASGYKTKFTFKNNIGDKLQAGLSWYNCFSFGNGLESNRIQDDFNAMFIQNGVKVSSIIQETYEEERRPYGLIYSGLYNSNSGLNDLNQFIMAEKITKDINPIYGSIQKLFSRNTDLVTFCEDKVLRILANKDAVFNADGNTNLTATENVLGQTVPFVGEYGISKNPESFASESYRAYFTDKARGAVLRLSKDGLTPISKTGMHDWFRDNLSLHTSLIGTYDSYKENYNLTLSNTYTENIIFNTFFQLGAESEQIDASVLSAIFNGQVTDGSLYSHSWESSNIYTSANHEFNTGYPEEFFKSTVTVTNHPFIAKGHFQQASSGTGQNIPDVIAVATTTPAVAEVPYSYAKFARGDGASITGGQPGGPYYSQPITGTLQNNGNFVAHDYGPASGDIFGASRDTDNFDLNGRNCYIERTYTPRDDGFAMTVTESSAASHSYHSLPYGISGYSWPTNGDPTVEKDAMLSYPVNTSSSYTGAVSQTDLRKASCTITRDSSTGYILFDRPYPTDSYVTLKSVGRIATDDKDSGGLLEDYHHNVYGTSTTASQDGVYHDQMYNGDEIHIRVKIRAFKQVMSGNNHYPHECYGFTYIKPKIELLDNGVPIASNKLVNMSDVISNLSQFNNKWQQVNMPYMPYSFAQSDPTSVGLCSVTGLIWSHDGGYLDNSTSQEVVSGTSIYGTWDTDTDRTHTKDFSTSSTMNFPSTKWMQGYGGHTHNASTSGTIDLTVGFSVKFRDPTQQNSDGSYSGSGDGITAAKVVDKLQIRISQTELNDDFSTPDLPGPYAQNGSGTTINAILPMGNPLWMIKKVECVKGFGITDAHTNYVPAAAAFTTYDDPSTSAVEAWTATQVQANGGVWDPTVNNGAGGYVLSTTWQQNQYPTVDVPAQDIPAWVSVNHQSFVWEAGNTTSGITGGGGGHWHEKQISSQFGNNRWGTQVYGDYIDPNTGVVTTNHFSWYEKGADPAGQSPQEGNYGNSASQLQPFNKTISEFDGTQHQPPGVASVSSTQSNPVSKTYTDIKSDYYRVKTHSTLSGHLGRKTITPSDPFEVGEWYMIDIELDPGPHPASLNYNGGATPSVATGGNDGIVSIQGVIDMGNFAIGDDLAAVGGFGLVESNGNCQTRWHWRTKYTGHDGVTEKWVLRAVFKIEAGSTTPLDEVHILFTNMRNSSINVRNVVCRKVSYKNLTGEAAGWTRGHTNGDEHLQINTLTDSKMYYHNGKLTFDEILRNDLPAQNYPWYPNQTYEVIWSQDLSPSGTNNQILNQGSGWIYKFSVGPNDKTGNFNGELGFMLSGDMADFQATAGGSGSNYTGIVGTGIVDQGDYEVNFTMDADTTNWSITRGGVDYSTTATLQEFGVAWNNTAVHNENKVMFYNAGSPALSCGVFNISLTQQETIFSGGQSGSWNYDGFDSTSEQFITWDIYWAPVWDPTYNNGQGGWDTGSSSEDGRLQFSNCPKTDPSFGNGNIVISANQYIDKVINRYEKYEISFNFKMQDQDPDTLASIDGQGLFHMYYFNSQGHGFRINDIGDESLEPDLYNGHPNYKKTAIYDTNGNFLWWRVVKIVGIGDGSVYDPATGNGNVIYNSSGNVVVGTGEDAYSEFDNGFGEALRDTLVIRKDGAGSSLLTGWIDDISMKRVYLSEDIDNEGFEGGYTTEKTISFNETVNGWSSFKSFIPESGVSLSKKYFTISSGFLHRHYTPLKYDDSMSSWVDCNYDEAENYNRFYNYLGEDAFNPSKLTAVFNTDPATVKTFHTLNYEGTQSFSMQPSTIDTAVVDGISNNQNIRQYYNILNSKLVTSQNSLAYSLGENIDGWKCVDIKTDLDNGSLKEFVKKEGKWFGYIKGKYSNTIDTSRFSIQGLGVPSEITEII
jgi:hypothetical protein